MKFDRVLHNAVSEEILTHNLKFYVFHATAQKELLVKAEHEFVKFCIV